jgi:hypothetical protein
VGGKMSQMNKKIMQLFGNANEMPYYVFKSKLNRIMLTDLKRKGIIATDFRRSVKLLKKSL